MSSRNYLGRRLAALREKGGLSQRQLADRAGVSQAFVSLVEGGGRELSRPYAMALADALGVSVDELQRKEKKS